MTHSQILIFSILAATVVLFLWGRFRHDVVALMALTACVVVGVVPSDAAFDGFGHPAVVTVACVLVLSQALQRTGAVDALARTVLPQDTGRLPAMAALMGLGAVLSAFMNNVGAMALLMPLAIQLSARLGLTPGQVLMPLAFGTILGGMMTLVGTPPNLIVAGFRPGDSFGMFDFAWIGLPVAALGIAVVVLVGWRLVPARKPAGETPFETGVYLTEMTIPEGAKPVGQTLRQFEDQGSGSGIQVVAMLRRGTRINTPHGARKIKPGDVLLIEAEAQDLADLAARLDIPLDDQKGQPEAAQTEGTETAKGTPKGAETATETATDSDADIVVREFAVLPGSQAIGRSARSMHLRSRHGVALLALSREGRKPGGRLSGVTWRSGDLLLVQGPVDVLGDFAREMSCVPLDTAPVTVPDRVQAGLASAIMVGAIALAALGILPAAVAFMAAVMVTMAARTLPLRAVYTAIDWPVIVLLAALIPVAGAMQSTGAADLLAGVLVNGLAQGNAVVALTVVLVVTMFLSDVMNNAATAAVMAPIALGIAATLGVGSDGFLMAVAIGASCAFLTPIGHQNNTLILGPGGFRFGDYWKLGLLIEALIVVAAVPLILIVWPL